MSATNQGTTNISCAPRQSSEPGWDAISLLSDERGATGWEPVARAGNNHSFLWQHYTAGSSGVKLLKEGSQHSRAILKAKQRPTSLFLPWVSFLLLPSKTLWRHCMVLLCVPNCPVPTFWTELSLPSVKCELLRKNKYVHSLLPGSCFWLRNTALDFNRN